jgi:hypothetical protein
MSCVVQNKEEASIFFAQVLHEGTGYLDVSSSPEQHGSA